jgi:NADH-quinone oxidoreductase subunit J
MNAALLLFLAIAAVSGVAALGVVLSRNIIHAALLLIVSMLAVAGIYILLFAEFLALVQILIYGGAVTVLLLFALMLTRAGEFSRTLDNPQKPFAVVAGLVFFGVLACTVLATRWGGNQVPLHPLEPVAIKSLGASLFGQWALPFEVASLVLLVALLGAIIIARTEEH